MTQFAKRLCNTNVSLAYGVREQGTKLSRMYVNIRLRVKLCMYSVLLSAGMIQYAKHKRRYQNVSLSITQKFDSTTIIALPYLQFAACFHTDQHTAAKSCLFQIKFKYEPKKCSEIDTASTVYSAYILHTKNQPG